MRIAVCDDNAIDREIITEVLRDYAEKNSTHLDITAYNSGVDLIYDIEDGYVSDIIFLDMYMDELLGIEVAHKLRKKGYEGEIVFLTATAEFAVDSYDVGAAAYLMKPHSYEKIFSVMDKILLKYISKTYQIRTRSNVVHIPLDEILYIDSNNNKCTLHRRDGRDYTVYKKLNDIEAELSAPHFLRCHQSYLVNMDYISRADKEFEMTNGNIIAIRQRDLKSICSAYFSYLSRQGKKYAK